MNMKFMSILLREGRKEDLKKKYATKFDDEVLDFVLGISDLQDFNHKYTDFILKALAPIDDIDYQVDVAVDLVKDFDKYQSQLPKKDINQYKTFSELEQALQPFQQKEKEKELEKSADKVYEDDKFVVIKPKTEEASCKYGSNTKWCVTSRGSGHFGRYTSGMQSLYFIINKANSTNKNYSKVAIHFDDGGEPRYWDSQDSPLGQREIEILNYAFPEMIDAIKVDYKKHAGSMTDRFLTQTFDSMGENSKEIRNYLSSDYNLSSLIRGFQNIPDLGFGHSEGRLSISLMMYKNYGTRDKLVDEYQVFITYKSKDEKHFIASVGFMGTDDATEDFVDLGLEGWGFDVTYIIGRTPAETAESVRRHISTRVLDHIANNPKLAQKLVGTSKVFTPTYGYTFRQNKGWVSRLVKFLDSGKIGTKLDFLLDVGYLQKVTKDGKTMYRKTKGQHLYTPRELRGQHASFFAAAKNAGILGYRKIGKDYFLVKGPNFDAFKSGQLKAL